MNLNPYNRADSLQATLCAMAEMVLVLSPSLTWFEIAITYGVPEQG